MKTLLPPGNTPPKKPQSQTGNFAKALLEAGGNVAQNAVDTGIKMANEAITSIFNANTSPTQQNENEQNKPDWLNQQKETTEQEWKKREAQLLRHREVNNVEVFDHRQIEVERRIEQLLSELEALTKDMDKAEREARQARITVMQNIVNPGEYHVSLLERYLRFVMHLRQKVKESASWLHMFNTRKSAQKGYWGQFYSQGTQWSMNLERNIATSVG